MSYSKAALNKFSSMSSPQKTQTLNEESTHLHALKFIQIFNYLTSNRLVNAQAESSTPPCLESCSFLLHMRNLLHMI